MSPHDALADGRLTDAVALQEDLVADAPADPAARLFLVELYAAAGRFDDATTHLDRIDSPAPTWPEFARSLHRLFRAERRRSEEGRKPVIRPEPIPAHAKRRWLAIKSLYEARPDRAVGWIDRADAATPEVRGFLDGQEFVGLRDADDRCASVLEAHVGGEFFWLPWEAVRRVKFAPAESLLDRLLRPAEVRLADGTEFPAHLPLVYPRSAAVDDVFALGLETDHVCPDGGPTRCVGGKLLLVGDGAEVPLGDVRMIEIRNAEFGTRN